MKKEFKIAVEKFQCPGCISGCDISCFEPNVNGGIGCGKHLAGTLLLGIGHLFLGMPKGFNRCGEFKDLKPYIYETFESSPKYDMWNIPNWKYLLEGKYTLVRGYMPRRNEPYIDIFLENCIDKINCLEIFQEDIDAMD